MTQDERRKLLLLMFVAFVVLAAGLGLRAPWPPDEPRFALIARDMVEHGNWLLPRVGGILYPDKPPLFFWMVACGYAVTGSINVAFLLPGLVAGLAVTFLVADLGRRLWDAQTGLWCAATLLAMLQFPLQMRGGQIDALLCLWTTLGLYGFLRHLLKGPDWRWYTIGGLAAGLGVITKGVGFLPYLVFLPMAIAARGDWSYRGAGWRDPRWLLAPAATFAAIAAWLVPMLVVTGTSDDPAYAAYRDNILLHQTVTRYTDSWGHIKPPWYLITHAAVWLWLPVTLLLPWLVPAWRRDFTERRLPTLLLAGWIVLVLLFFSLSDGKRAVYIFPAVPAVALLAGSQVRDLLRQRLPGRMVFAWPLALAAVLVALAACLFLDPARVLRWASGTDVVWGAARALFATGLAMAVALAVAALRGHPLRGIAAALVLFWIGTGVLLAPVLDGDRSGRWLVQSASDQLARGRELGLVDWPEQFLLYADRSVTHFGYRRPQEDELADGVAWAAADANRTLLLPTTLAERCFEPRAIQPLGRAHRRTWALAGADGLLPACRDVAPELPVQAVLYAPPGHAKDFAGASL